MNSQSDGVLIIVIFSVSVWNWRCSYFSSPFLSSLYETWSWNLNGSDALPIWWRLHAWTISLSRVPPQPCMHIYKLYVQKTLHNLLGYQTDTFSILQICSEYGHKTDWFSHLFLLLLVILWNFCEVQNFWQPRLQIFGLNKCRRKENFTEFCSWWFCYGEINPRIWVPNFLIAEPDYISSSVEQWEEMENASDGSCFFFFSKCRWFQSVICSQHLGFKHKPHSSPQINPYRQRMFFDWYNYCRAYIW